MVPQFRVPGRAHKPLTVLERRSSPGADRKTLALLALLTVWVAGYQLSDTVAPSLRDWLPFHDVWIDVLTAAAGLLTLTRGVRGERAWVLIGLGTLLWAAGDSYWSLELSHLAAPPVPSWSDAGYLSFCPLAFAGMFALLRSRTASRINRTMVIDALAAALATGAVSAAIVVRPVLASAAGGTLAVATNLAYPLCDLLLLGLIVAAISLFDWRLNRRLLLLLTAVAAFWVADSLYLIASATSSYHDNDWYNPLWTWCPVLIAWAAWLPSRPPRRAAAGGSGRSIGMLLGFATVAIGVLVWSSVSSLGVLAIVFATGSLIVMLVRLALTWRENIILLRRTQDDLITDGLTGLRNRRGLALDLERVFDSGTDREPMLLAMFDLDGFKHYNDTFGHPAGDALLQRLASSLEAYLGARGTAYRMGGDEFCALLALGPSGAESLVVGAAAALSERGEGFAVGCSHGWVRIPEEADEPAEALRVADQRMYSNKSHGRMSASAQSRHVLRSALAERNAELATHLTDVAELAAETAAALALPAEQVEEIRGAAELHDVGKVAIPDAILNKPGPLDDDEWAFIRRHTVIGERIINAAPALRGIGALVRASHENYDGSGYPDGLARDEIPLGARIIAVCDAFDAMTTDRPYRPAMPLRAALAELRRCAGTQFDPAVVERFTETVLERQAETAERARNRSLVSAP